MKPKYLSIAGLMVISAVATRMVYAQTLDKFLYMPAIFVAPTPTQTSVPTITPTPTQAPLNLTVLSYSYFTPSFGGTALVGEFRNDTSETVSVDAIYADFLDEHGSILFTRRGYTSDHALEPGGKYPFLTGFEGEPQTYPAVRFRFEFLPKVIGQHRLPLANLTGGINPSNGRYRISGSITNDTTTACRDWRTTATLYDASGKVIGIDIRNETPPIGFEFQPGQIKLLAVDVEEWAGKTASVAVSSFAIRATTRCGID